MRVSRVKKFKSLKWHKIKRVVLLWVLLPIGVAFTGYIINTLFILPSIRR